jgi:hypothetical protein
VGVVEGTVARQHLDVQHLEVGFIADHAVPGLLVHDHHPSAILAFGRGGLRLQHRSREREEQYALHQGVRCAAYRQTPYELHGWVTSAGGGMDRRVKCAGFCAFRQRTRLKTFPPSCALVRF